MLYPSPSLGNFLLSLLQRIVGSGTPDAVQAMTTGDILVTISSVGSSAIDGGTKWTEKRLQWEHVLPIMNIQFKNQIIEVKFCHFVVQFWYIGNNKEIVKNSMHANCKEMLCHLPWTVRLMDLESSPASLVTTHLYTAVSSTVGAIITKEPDESNLSVMIRDKVNIWK